jgi:hypothetical protein
MTVTTPASTVFTSEPSTRPDNAEWSDAGSTPHGTAELLLSADPVLRIWCAFMLAGVINSASSTSHVEALLLWMLPSSRCLSRWPILEPLLAIDPLATVVVGMSPTVVSTTRDSRWLCAGLQLVRCIGGDRFVLVATKLVAVALAAFSLAAFVLPTINLAAFALTALQLVTVELLALLRTSWRRHSHHTCKFI